LGRIKYHKAGGVLINVLKDKTDSEYVLSASMVALQKIKDPRAFDVLVDLMNDDKAIREHLRIDSVWTLVEINSPAVVDVLMAALKVETNDNFLREAIILALGTTQDPRAADPLIEILKGQGDDDIDNNSLRVKSAWALGRIKSPEAMDALVEVWKDEVEDVVLLRAIGAAFKRIGSPALPYLIKVLRDRQFEKREAVQEILIQIDDVSVIPILAILGTSKGDRLLKALEHQSAKFHYRAYSFGKNLLKFQGIVFYIWTLMAFIAIYFSGPRARELSFSNKFLEYLIHKRDISPPEEMASLAQGAGRVLLYTAIGSLILFTASMIIPIALIANQPAFYWLVFLSPWFFAASLFLSIFGGYYGKYVTAIIQSLYTTLEIIFAFPWNYYKLKRQIAAEDLPPIESASDATQDNASVRSELRSALPPNAAVRLRQDREGPVRAEVRTERNVIQTLHKFKREIQEAPESASEKILKRFLEYLLLVAGEGVNKDIFARVVVEPLPLFGPDNKVAFSEENLALVLELLKKRAVDARFEIWEIVDYFLKVNPEAFTEKNYETVLAMLTGETNVRYAGVGALQRFLKANEKYSGQTYLDRIFDMATRWRMQIPQMTIPYFLEANRKLPRSANLERMLVLLNFGHLYIPDKTDTLEMIKKILEINKDALIPKHLDIVLDLLKSYDSDTQRAAMMTMRYFSEVDDTYPTEAHVQALFKMLDYELSLTQESVLETILYFLENKKKQRMKPYIKLATISGIITYLIRIQMKNYEQAQRTPYERIDQYGKLFNLALNVLGALVSTAPMRWAPSHFEAMLDLFELLGLRSFWDFWESSFSEWIFSLDGVKMSSLSEENITRLLALLESENTDVRNAMFELFSLLIQKESSFRERLAPYESFIENVLSNRYGILETLKEWPASHSLEEAVTLGAKLNYSIPLKVILRGTMTDLGDLASWIKSNREDGSPQEVQISVGYDTGDMPPQEDRGKFISLYLFMATTDLAAFQALKSRPDRVSSAAYGLLIRGDVVEVVYPGQEQGKRLDYIFNLSPKMTEEDLVEWLRHIRLLNLGLLLASALEAYAVFFPNEQPAWMTDKVLAIAEAYRDFEKDLVRLLRSYDARRDPEKIYELKSAVNEEEANRKKEQHRQRQAAFEKHRLEDVLYPEFRWVVPLYSNDNQWDRLLPALRGVEGMMLRQGPGKVGKDRSGNEVFKTVGRSFIDDVRVLGYASAERIEKILQADSVEASPSNPRDPFIDSEDEEATIYYLKKMVDAVSRGKISAFNLLNVDTFQRALEWYEVDSDIAFERGLAVGDEFETAKTAQGKDETGSSAQVRALQFTDIYPEVKNGTQSLNPHQRNVFVTVDFSERVDINDLLFQVHYGDLREDRRDWKFIEGTVVDDYVTSVRFRVHIPLNAQDYTFRVSTDRGKTWTWMGQTQPLSNIHIEEGPEQYLLHEKEEALTHRSELRRARVGSPQANRKETVPREEPEEVPEIVPEEKPEPVKKPAEPDQEPKPVKKPVAPKEDPIKEPAENPDKEPEVEPEPETVPAKPEKEPVPAKVSSHSARSVPAPTFVTDVTNATRGELEVLLRDDVKQSLRNPTRKGTISLAVKELNSLPLAFKEELLLAVSGISKLRLVLYGDPSKLSQEGAKWKERFVALDNVFAVKGSRDAALQSLGLGQIAVDLSFNEEMALQDTFIPGARIKELKHVVVKSSGDILVARLLATIPEEHLWFIHSVNGVMELLPGFRSELRAYVAAQAFAWSA